MCLDIKCVFLRIGRWSSFCIEGWMKWVVNNNMCFRENKV